LLMVIQENKETQLWSLHMMLIVPERFQTEWFC
jgi:hypothetical protein